MKKIAILTGSVFALFPLVASAQNVNVGFFTNFIGQVSGLISAAVPVVIGLAVLLFLWGLARYMLNQDDAEARAGARSIMIWGIVIIFVMVSIWGLVAFLGNLTGVGQGGGLNANVSPI